MDILDAEFPDFSDHPPPPRMTLGEYERWILDEIIPDLVRRGEMADEKVMEHFMRNEGRMTEFRM